MLKRQTGIRASAVLLLQTVNPVGAEVTSVFGTENRPWASLLEALIQIKPPPPFSHYSIVEERKYYISTKCHHLGCSINCLIIKQWS